MQGTNFRQGNSKCKAPEKLGKETGECGEPPRPAGLQGKALAMVGRGKA